MLSENFNKAEISGKKYFYFFLFIIGFKGLTGQTIGYLLPIYFKQMGFSGLQIGLYFSISSIAMILLSLPMGISTDSKSIAAILMLSFFLMGLSKLGLIISDSLLILCIFAFLGSFGGRFYMIAKNSMFFKMMGSKNVLENHHRAGFYQLFLFLCMGTGMLIGGVIIADFSFKHVFVLIMVSNLILVGFSYFLPRNKIVIIKFQEYKKAIFNPNVLFLTFIFFLASLHQGAEIVSYGPFLKENLGLSIKQTGLYTSLGFIFVGFGAYGGVLLIKKGWIKNLQSLLSIGFFLSGVFHILMCVPHVYWSFFFRVFHEIGDGFIVFTFFSGISKIFHLDKIGGCAAFISLCIGLGSMGSSIIFGVIGDNYGYQWPLIISGIVLAVIPVLLLLKRPGELYREA